MFEVSLRVYDCVDLNNEADFTDRYQTITNITNGAKYLSLVENVRVDNEEEIHAAQARFVEEGYEGAMVRNLTGAYAIGKRSANLQKVKTFLDGNTLSSDSHKALAEKQVVSFECSTSDGQTFRVRPREHRRTARCSLKTEVIMSDSN